MNVVHRYFPDFEHVFAHWIGHICFNFRTPSKKRVSLVLIFAHPSCVKIVGGTEEVRENYCHAKFEESKVSDDIIIYSKSVKDHVQTLEILFRKIKELGLKLNQNKCVFLKESLSFFGIIITSNGIKPDPSKTENIKNAKRPSNVQELRSFLGLISYVSRFIPNFSEKTAPLRKLLKNDVKFVWNSEQQKAFNILKKELIGEKVLKYFDPTNDVELVTDASGNGIGGVLLQKDSKNEIHPVAYISRSLNSTEVKYSIM